MESIYLKKVREGDTEAFAYFVEKYSSRSYSLALSFLKNEANAEDIVQISFIKAFKAISKFREDSKFSTWLFRIIVNECTQYFRRKKPELPGNIQEIPIKAYEINNSDLLRNERKNILKNAISKLKTREALLIRLHYLCELDHEEIREITGLSLSNCKVILHRARKNLKSILETQLADEIHMLK